MDFTISNNTLDNIAPSSDASENSHTTEDDFQKAEPLLYDELLRRQQSLLVELEKWVTEYANLKGIPQQKKPVLETNYESWVMGILMPESALTDLELSGMDKAEVCDLHQQALTGRAEKLFQLSKHYFSGKVVPEDPFFAFRLVRFVAEQGYRPAFSILGKYYAYGIGTRKKPEEAARWLLQTDYSQDEDTLAFLAWCHYTGTGVPKDEAKAWDLWLDAAEQGHSERFRFCQAAANAGHTRGQFFLGHFYQHGIGTPADIQTALRLFHLSAEQGYVHAQCRLGILYSEGNFGIEKDPEVAVQWLRLAASQNDLVARSRLADFLVNGEGVKQNIGEAVQILGELSQESLEHPKGEPSSQYRLGVLLTNKEYAGSNPKEGIKWLRKSAEQSFAPAQAALGMLYYNGFEDTVKQNLKEARNWFRKAAKKDIHAAQYHLGEIFFDGSGVPVNRKEAVVWYKKASEGGYVPAQQKLAHCYLNGIGTKKNEEDGYLLLASLALWGDEEALTLLQSAAITGNPAAEFGMWVYEREQKDAETALHWLESATEKGDNNALCLMAIRCGEEGDHEQKLRYFRLAAEKGNAEAQTRLAIALENVLDKKAPENEEAFKWMKAAADQGHAHANYFLGNFYRSGTWVDADGQKAFECYSKAAEQRDSDGIERLGECYANGTGVAEDEHVAFRCFQHAAELGNPKGQCYLGLHYLNGIGCHQDTELAFRWISQAVDSGHPVVFQILQDAGLDITKLSGGFKQFRQYQAAMTGQRFGENFDQIFSDPQKSILPMPPGEKSRE